MTISLPKLILAEFVAILIVIVVIVLGTIIGDWILKKYWLLQIKRKYKKKKKMEDKQLKGVTNDK